VRIGRVGRVEGFLDGLALRTVSWPEVSSPEYSQMTSEGGVSRAKPESPAMASRKSAMARRSIDPSFVQRVHPLEYASWPRRPTRLASPPAGRRAPSGARSRWTRRSRPESQRRLRARDSKRWTRADSRPRRYDCAVMRTRRRPFERCFESRSDFNLCRFCDIEILP